MKNLRTNGEFNTLFFTGVSYLPLYYLMAFSIFAISLTHETTKFHIQGATEIGALILTGNRTRQKEQLFYLPFCRKTMFNSKKKLERFFTKIALRH
jgi:hypothetical protein